MLVLSRKPKESIIINGNVTVSVLRIDSDNVRIGIEAPMEIPVMRQEIYNEISQNNQAAAGLAKAKVKLKVKELVKS
ncbi:MAG: carbon storage regulator CsrA [Verrucomicrobiota bacterium]|jgi:carbon storage regulator|nr:carbon storage regulator CsrA [Verrucomicrobiota bacterium]